jgi:hypothetical protein
MHIIKHEAFEDTCAINMKAINAIWEREPMLVSMKAENTVKHTVWIYSFRSNKALNLCCVAAQTHKRELLPAADLLCRSSKEDIPTNKSQMTMLTHPNSPIHAYTRLHAKRHPHPTLKGSQPCRTLLLLPPPKTFSETPTQNKPSKKHVLLWPPIVSPVVAAAHISQQNGDASQPTRIRWHLPTTRQPRRSAWWNGWQSSFSVHDRSEWIIRGKFDEILQLTIEKKKNLPFSYVLS